MKSLFAFAALALAVGAQAQVVTIDQAKALAGNVTPGDAPGFPITISQPGHYRLTGALKVDDLQAIGIQIPANVGPVVIDLNGFSLTGARCGPVRCHIGSPYSVGILGGRHVTVMNGVVTNFGYLGIHIAESGVLANLQVTSNGYCGAMVNRNSLVRDSMFTDNLHCGLWLTNSVVHSSLVARNGSLQVHTAGPSLASSSSFLGAGTKGGLVSAGNNLCSSELVSGSGTPC